MKKKQAMADAIKKAEAIDIKNTRYSIGKEKSGGCGCGGKQKMEAGTAKGGCGCGGKSEHGMQEGGKMSKTAQGMSTTDHMREKAMGMQVGRAQSIQSALAKEATLKNKM
jgi:hypothetical protein